MASALPVLISPGTGAASSLAGPAMDGAPFNLTSPETAARQLHHLATGSDEFRHGAPTGSRSRVQTHAAPSAFGMGLAGLL
jgi:hypothetical protein